MSYFIDFIKLGINATAQIYQSIKINIFNMNVNLFDIIIGAVMVSCIMLAFIVITRKK